MLKSVSKTMDKTSWGMNLLNISWKSINKFEWIFGDDFFISWAPGGAKDANLGDATTMWLEEGYVFTRICVDRAREHSLAHGTLCMFGVGESGAAGDERTLLGPFPVFLRVSCKGAQTPRRLDLASLRSLLAVSASIFEKEYALKIFAAFYKIYTRKKSTRLSSYFFCKFYNVCRSFCRYWKNIPNMSRKLLILQD